MRKQHTHDATVNGGPVTTIGSPKPPAYELPPRLGMKRRSWYIKEVAHTFAAGSCESRGRILGLLVVALTTIIGTGTFAALQNNPSQAAKLTVAILAVAAAVAAAVKEFFQYGKTSAEHLEEAAKYGSLKDQADDLADELEGHAVERSYVDKQLIALEKEAATLDRTPPMVVGRPYRKAEKWVREKEAQETAGGLRKTC